MFLSVLVLLTAPPALAQTESSGTVRFALIEDRPVGITSILQAPIERVLSEEGSRAALVEVRNVPCRYGGREIRYRYGQSPVSTGTFPAAALGLESEVAVVSPPEPRLMEALRRAAADPATYRSAWSASPTLDEAAVSLSRDADGDVLASVRLSPASAGAVNVASVASVYRLKWNGQDVQIVVVGRLYGGMGRLAAALNQENAAGPVIGVARSGLFDTPLSGLAGARLAEALERLGLAYSAVSNSDLRRWTEFSAYRKEHPDGVRFLSANLVYSTASGTSFFPDSAIVETGGLKVAITALTPPSAAKYLRQAGLKGLRVSEPLEALQRRIVKLHEKADLIVLLADLSDETLGALRQPVRGVDLVLAGEESSPDETRAPPDAETAEKGRREFEHSLWTMRASYVSLDVLEARLSRSGARRDLSVKERHILLDDQLSGAPGFPEFDPSSAGITQSTSAALIPADRLLYPPENGKRDRVMGARGFWTLAAALAAEDTRSEAALLRVWPLPVNVDTDISEGIVRAWLKTEDQAVAVSLKGSELKALVAEAEAQRRRAEKGSAEAGALRFTAGGLDPGDKIHGLAIEDHVLYRVVTTEVLADAKGLSSGHDLVPLGRTIDDLVLAALRARAGSSVADYRRWIEGRPVSERGLWRLDFRDVGFNIQNTKVVRDEAFNAVPNSRIQGFDELRVGEVFKADAEFLRTVYKWSSTLEMEYARSRLAARGQPPVSNITANRIMFLTTGTRRQGSIPWEWLARSWGPSLGGQFDGQFEPAPGLKRKEVYSGYPGLEFYDGSFIRSLKVSGNIIKDLSRNPPDTQWGLHTQIAFEKTLKTGASLRGDLFTNYTFLTGHDAPQDLRLEGDLTVKVKIPIYKYLSVAPFVDFYYFGLKVRPVFGYSAMTGVSLSFSRLWKPQYESF